MGTKVLTNIYSTGRVNTAQESQLLPSGASETMASPIGIMRLSTVLFGCMLIHDIHTTPIVWRSAEQNPSIRETKTDSHSNIFIPPHPFHQRRLEAYPKVTISRKRSTSKRKNYDVEDARRRIRRDGKRREENSEDRCNCTREVQKTEERQLDYNMPERTKTALNVAIDVLLTIIQPYFGMPGAVVGKLIRPFLFYLATRMFTGGTDFFKNMLGDESPGGLRDEPYAAYPIYIPGYGSYILLSDVGPSELINTTSIIQEDEAGENVNEKDKPDTDDKDSVSEEKDNESIDARSRSNTRSKERNRHRNHDRDKHKHRNDKYSTSSEEKYRDSRETDEDRDDDSEERYDDSRERDRDKDRRDRNKEKRHKHRDKDTKDKHKDKKERDKFKDSRENDSSETTEKYSSEKDSGETKDKENDKDLPDLNVSSGSMKIVNIQSKFNPLFLGQTHLIPIFKKPRVFESEKDLEEANWSSETDDSIRESIKQIVGSGERIKSLKKRIMLKILEKLHSAVLQF